MKRFSLALIGSLALLQPALAADAPLTAKADFVDQTGKSVGTATLRALPEGVLIHVDLKGLPPGPHGFHIHEAGKCEPAQKFKSAGGHFNPTHKAHGVLSGEGPHAGDLPNLYVPGDGHLQADLIDDAVTLSPGPSSLLKTGGTAFVVHAKPDDYKSQPAGDAGDRLACGVIVSD